MATPKKRTARSTPRRGHAEQREKRDQYTVVLEDLHSKFDAFGESLQIVQADVADVKTRLSNVETGLETGLEDVRRELRAGFARVEAALDKKVDRDEVQGMIARGLAGR